MKLRYRIGLTLLTLVAISLAGLAIALSYESDCGPAPALAENHSLPLLRFARRSAT
jgi:hypothetical protein